MFCFLVLFLVLSGHKINMGSLWEETDTSTNEILVLVKISRVQTKKKKSSLHMAGTILISTESLYPVLAKLTLKKKSSDQINIRTEKKVGNNLA